MTDQMTIQAEFREHVGKGASRRLRRLADKAPAILYGGDGDPVPLAIPYNELAKAMKEEAFFSQILSLQVGDKTQSCILRDLQRHPATERVQHIDFLRIREDLPINVRVPLHFLNEEQCVGVKLGGGRLAHNLIEVEVSCLPKDLPAFITVDVEALEVGQSIHLSDLEIPENVAIVALGLGDDHDTSVVSVSARRGGGQAEEEDAPAADEDAEADDSSGDQEDA